MQGLPSYPPVVTDDLTVDPVFTELQRSGPFKAQLPLGEPIWIATRYDDVKTIHADRRFGKSMGYGHDTPRLKGHAHGSDPTRLDNMDPPNHTRVRRLASHAFAPQQIRGMAGWIEGMTSDLLDEVVAAGQEADLVDILTWQLPLQVITGILGAPPAMIPVLKDLVDRLTSPISELEQKMEAYSAMKDIVRGLIVERREAPTDDLLNNLVQAQDDDDRFDDDELVNLSMTLFLGGFETTAAQLGNTIWTLLAHRDLWEELLDDRELVPAAMEELWRWIPSFRHGNAMVRWANEDVELSGGVVIPKGEAVLPEHVVANRDDSVFQNGSQLDFHRPDPQPHLALAWGTHRCMGARLAHMEVESVLVALLDRFPKLDLAVAPEEVAWSPTSGLRSPASLPVTF